MAIPPATSFNAARPYASKKVTTLTSDPALMTALGMAGFMVLTILATLAAGRGAAMLSLAVLACGVLYCAATRLGQGLPLLIGYFALEGLYKYTSNFSQVVYIVKPVLELSLLVGLMMTNRQTGKALQMPPLAALVALLGGWSIVEAFHPLGTGFAQGIIQSVIWYLAPMSLLWTGYNVTRSTRQIEALCYTLVAVSVVVSLFAIFQYTMGQTWTEAHLPGYSAINQGEWVVVNKNGSLGPVSWRPASTTVIGGGGSLWAMWGVAAAIGLLLSEKIKFSWKLVLLASLSINAYGIILSGSRLFLIVAMLQGVFLLAVMARSPRELARNVGIALLVGVMVWIGFNGAQSTSDGIITSRYSETLADPMAKYGHDRGGIDGRAAMLYSMLGPYPLGVGYQRGVEGGNSRTRAATGGYPVNRDDAFNSMAGDMGWPGLILVLCLVPAVLVRCWRSFAVLKNNRAARVGRHLPGSDDGLPRLFLWRSGLDRCRNVLAVPGADAGAARRAAAWTAGSGGSR